MRPAVAAFVAALIVQTPAPSLAAGLVRALFKVSDEVAEVGATAARAAAREAEAIRGLSRGRTAAWTDGEREAWVSAYHAMPNKLVADGVGGSITRFKALALAGDEVRAGWPPSAPLAEDLPHVKVRAPSALDGRIVRPFAQARLANMLEAPFETARVRVVVAGLADDLAASSGEMARFRRSIPRDNLDEVGFLARLGQGPALSHAEKVRRLEAYRGDVVIVVGHVRDGSEDFFRFAADGSARPLDLPGWLAAAREARVDIVPIGCNAERFADLATVGLVNSRIVRDRLREVLQSGPATYRDFLKTLTGPDLTLVIDPFDTRLFAGGGSLINSQGRSVGRIVLTGARVARSAGGSGRSAPATCLAEQDRIAFGACITRLEVADNARMREANAACWTERRRALPLAVAKARRQLAAAIARERRSGIGYGLSATFLLFVFLAYPRAREVERENGGAWAALFSRARLNDAGARAAAFVRAPRAHAGEIIGTALLLTGLIAPLLTSPDWVVQVQWTTAVVALLILFGLIGEVRSLRSGVAFAAVVATMGWGTLAILHHDDIHFRQDAEAVLRSTKQLSVAAQVASPAVSCLRLEPHGEIHAWLDALPFDEPF